MTACALRVSDAELNRWNGFLGVNSVRAENSQTAVRALPSKASNDLFRNRADLSRSTSHSSSPSLRPQHGEGRAEMKSESVTRSLGTAKDEARTQLQRSLELHVTDPAKIVARKVEASPDTVEAHRQAVPKSWAQMIAYCRAYPAFALDVVEQMGLDLDRDREAYAVFLQLQKSIQGRSK